ncbi:hypothetical protein GUJ93_ZPchr0009g1727 [Zizania palustris]|uniref:Uncharacterized protein n=1 Tax=Zizania palustris TaxID=103762 RepID=A0A8J5VLH5_ZIZPA|nr:hypothetical protein GUJ93_ZPchr0009g1727 [Zizania palustris]
MLPALARLLPPCLPCLSAPRALRGDEAGGRGDGRRAGTRTGGAGGGEHGEVRRWWGTRGGGRVRGAPDAARGARDAVADVASLVQPSNGRTRLTWLWFGAALAE